MPKLHRFKMQLILSRYPGLRSPSYNNNVRTKVNALNLISVLVIFSEVALQVRGRGQRGTESDL